MRDERRFDGGLQVRRAVLGDRHVRASLDLVDPFWQPLQEMTTSFAWGEIWTRDGLDRRTRSAMTLGMLIALGRWKELEVHVVGALNNGLTQVELRELVMHAAVYSGFPAALEASRSVQAAIDRHRAENAGD